MVRIDSLAKLEQEIESIRLKVLSTTIQGRWIWTSGQTLVNGFIPWDNEIINSSSGIFQWKQHTADILVKLPGLYRYFSPRPCHIFLIDR